MVGYRENFFSAFVIHTGTIATGATSAIQIDVRDKDRHGQMNGLRFNNGSNQDINILLDGDFNKRFRVPASMTVQIDPEDGILYSGTIVIVSAGSGTVGASELSATISKSTVLKNQQVL